MVNAPGTVDDPLIALLRSGDTFSPRLSNEEPLRIECRQFARSVQGREVPRTDGRQGVAVVEVLEALQRSLDLGGAVVPVAPALLAA